MHPGLPLDMVLWMVGQAAFALERNAHTSAARLTLDLQKIAGQATLSWPGARASELEMHDDNRITEDGAEAVALALVHRGMGWRTIRRIQRGDHADWLLRDASEGRPIAVALEVSGVDKGSIAARLSEKLKQVSKSDAGDQRWACVVGFQEPVAALHRSMRRARGN